MPKIAAFNINELLTVTDESILRQLATPLINLLYEEGKHFPLLIYDNLTHYIGVNTGKLALDKILDKPII